MKRKNKRHLKKGFKIFLIIVVLTFVIGSLQIKLNKDNYDNTFITENESLIPDINYKEDLTTLEKLKILSEYDKRVDKIINNYDEYPEILLESLINNPDMLDFVLDYPDKLGNTYSDSVGDIKDGEVPLLLQWDKRWGYARYGGSSIAISGCGPTALSMVIVSLTKDKSMTPYKVAKFAEDNGYYSDATGTAWSLMSEGARKLGVESRELPLSKTVIFNALENGHPIICSMRPGDFTKSGHYIVLAGIKDGKIKVNDPNSKERSDKLWDYEKIEGQIKNLWEYYL